MKGCSAKRNSEEDAEHDYCTRRTAGRGQGTQARRIADKYGIPQLSTGDMFREKIASGDELGKKIKGIVESGNLVPSEITIQMIVDRIKEPDCANGFLLDGFPRNVEQAEGLEKALKEAGKNLDAVVQLDVNDDELVERISGRFTCACCDEGYHDKFKNRLWKIHVMNAVQKGNLNAALMIRRKRLRYALMSITTRQRRSLAYYQSRDLLDKVNGMQDMDKVSEDISAVLDAIAAGDAPKRKTAVIRRFKAA